jgi:hypothetical protein
MRTFLTFVKKLRLWTAICHAEFLCCQARMENTYLASRIGARPGRREAASGVVHQIESSRVVFGLGMELDLLHGGGLKKKTRPV